MALTMSTFPVGNEIGCGVFFFGGVGGGFLWGAGGGFGADGGAEFAAANCKSPAKGVGSSVASFRDASLFRAITLDTTVSDLRL